MFTLPRIARNSGHFEPVSNRQRYITLSFEMSRSNMAQFAANRSRKRVSDDVPYSLSTAYLLYVGSKEKKRRQVNSLGFFTTERIVAISDDAEVREN